MDFNEWYGIGEKWYKVGKWLWEYCNNWSKKQQEDNPDDGDLPEPSVWRNAVMHTGPKSIQQSPCVSKLTVSRAGNKLTFSVTKPELWPVIEGCSGDVHVILFRNGAWHTGPCDSVRAMPYTKRAKDMCIPDGDKRLYEIQPEEKVGFVVTPRCRYSIIKGEPKCTTEVWFDSW